MNQRSRIHTLFTNYLWLLGIIVAGVLLLAQQAHALGLSIGIVYVPLQAVDLDGDGLEESFSGELTVYDDGTADGGFFIAEDLFIEPQSGQIACTDDGTAVAEAESILYQIKEDALVEIGMVTIFTSATDSSHSLGGGGDFIMVDIVGSSAASQSTRGGNLGGGDIILVDIVGSSAVVTGSLDFAVDPCSN